MTFIADDASISLNELTLRSLITIPLLFALAAKEHVEMRRIATAESAALMVVFIVVCFFVSLLFRRMGWVIGYSQWS